MSCLNTEPSISSFGGLLIIKQLSSIHTFLNKLANPKPKIQETIIFPVLFLHTALGQITGLQPGSYTETSLPGGIFDVNDDGDTSDGVYWVNSLENLLWIAENSFAWSDSYIYYQGEDIDMSPTKYWDDSDDNGNGNKYDDPEDGDDRGNNEGFPSIAYGTGGQFEGVYNGNYRRIISLTINRPSATEPIGFFSKAAGSFTKAAKILKLGFVNGNVHGGNKQVGGVVGYVSSISRLTYIDEVFYEGTVQKSSTDSEDVGGIIGEYVEGQVLSNSFFKGKIINTGSGDTGGIAGEMRSSLGFSNLFAKVEFHVDRTNLNRVGGLIGFSLPTNESLQVENGYTVASVQNSKTTTTKMGGIVGSPSGSYPETSLYRDLYYEYSTDVEENYTGYLGSSTTFTNVVSKTQNDLASVGALAFSGLNSSTVWGQNDSFNEGYPYLKGWIDYGLSSSFIDESITTTSTVGTFTFIDGGNPSVNILAINLKSGELDNDDFVIQSSGSVYTIQLKKSATSKLATRTQFEVSTNLATNESPTRSMQNVFKFIVKDFNIFFI